jgi:hypothetical protein
MSATFAKYVLAAAAILVSSNAMLSSAEASDRIRYRCKAVGSVDISMAAKYETRSSGRKKFSTEFEAAPNLGFAAGQRLNVEVKGTVVGSMLLDTVLGGDVVGDLNFDTRPSPPDEVAFPTNWPAGVGKDTDVKVLKGTTVVLGCSLR